MEWRIITILGFDYMISEFGDLISCETGRLNKSFPNKHGYHRYRFQRRKLGINRMEAKHRLVAKVFLPRSKDNDEVNHLDGDKNNNHYSNLEWTNRSENMKHAFRLGLHTNAGENNPNYGKGKKLWNLNSDLKIT